MSELRGYRRRKNCTLATKRERSRTRLNPTLRQSFRKLQRILEDIVDDGLHHTTNDDTVEPSWEEVDSETDVEERDLGGKARATSFSGLQAFRARGVRGRSETGIGDDSDYPYRLNDLCERHGNLTDQIQSSLKALGGGGRTAWALETMHSAVIRIANSFDVDKDKSVRLQPHDCMKALDDYKEAVSEATEAFKELGVFNNNFLDALEVLLARLGVTAAKLEAEYGALLVYHMDKYLGSVFEPLILDFDIFLVELANVAEKEIMAIRRTQGFTSQRYLNLTTVATFLSSVTASTLQITADDTGPLASVTNTSWLISLTFSTASAINSLFVMTWRQSSVRRPELVLPYLVNLWFQNGPMYTLIAAVMTFSVGLSLLAFRAAKEQSARSLSAVPTAFAGFYACLILLFSAWFIREQWKARTMKLWGSAMDGCVLSLIKTWRKHVSIIKYSVRRWKWRARWQLVDYRMSFGARCTIFWRHPPSSTLDVDQRNMNDIESARSNNSAEDITSVQSMLEGESFPAREQENSGHPASQSSDIGVAWGTIKRRTGTAESDLRSNPRGPLDKEYKSFESILQFSPHGRFLACAYNDTVAIYDVQDSFSTVASISTPDGKQAKHISWNPSAFRDAALSDSGELIGELLVISPGSISVWNIRYSEEIRHDWTGQSISKTIRDIQADLVGELRETVAFVQWTDEENSGVKGFICATNTTVRLFNEKFQQQRTIDLLDKGDINNVIAAAFYRNNYLICLADVSEVTARCDWLFVINLTDNSIKSARRTYRGHTSITVSSAADKVLLHGSDRGVWLIDLRDFNTSLFNSMDDPVLWGQTLGLRAPEEAITFHGHRDNMIVGYSAGEVVALYYKRDDKYLSALHTFTTPTIEAIPQNPISFAINPALDSEPYMFAFRDQSGRITIWSVQSNKQLLKCSSAKTMVVYDGQGVDSEEITTTTGRFLTLDPPTDPAAKTDTPHPNEAPTMSNVNW